MVKLDDYGPFAKLYIICIRADISITFLLFSARAVPDPDGSIL